MSREIPIPPLTGTFKRRLLNELAIFNQRTPPRMSLDGPLQDERHFKVFYVNVQGTEGTLCDGEKFKLQFKYNYLYPIEPPIVSFVGENIPVHPQVERNGRICLSILTSDWTIEFTVHSICLLILNLLRSSEEKGILEDYTELKTGKKIRK
ncbi:ubiquitin-conjugating enzyme E2 W-like [Myzus persicae]|uniref:ubiquitin-conjugating enzyme E2 W-like n=1 Tax=Myzus persicae TaxID=13164 RepID=UPI000B936E54|nr:ubiquitin-conjugating enzyme E2 W-like [Myzus persicae]